MALRDSRHTMEPSVAQSELQSGSESRKNILTLLEDTYRQIEKPLGLEKAEETANGDSFQRYGAANMAQG